MTGILDKFHVEHGIHGTRVLARSNQLTSYYSDEREIDGAIQLLTKGSALGILRNRQARR